jgi:hypothetical protein
MHTRVRVRVRVCVYVCDEGRGHGRWLLEDAISAEAELKAECPDGDG